MHSPDLYEGSDPPLQLLTTCSNEYVYVSYKSMTLLHLLSFLPLTSGLFLSFTTSYSTCRPNFPRHNPDTHQYSMVFSLSSST
jgi:hypothetical protein